MGYAADGEGGPNPALEGLRAVSEHLLPLLEDPLVYEIQLQPNGHVYGLEAGGGIRFSKELALEEGNVSLFLSFASSGSGERFDEGRDYFLACRLPNAAPFFKARLHAMLPAVAGGVLVAIRKHPERSYDLEEDYLGKEILSATQVAYLRRLMAEQRSNLLIVGATGSGKTQLANALLSDTGKRYPGRRVGVIEDVPEIVQPTARSFGLQTTILAPPRDRPQAGQQVVGLADLIPHCLRLTPDGGLVLGELRIERAAQALLEAWETGHPGGLTTIHAGGPKQGLKRLRNLAVGDGQGLDVEARIGEAIDTVVFIKRVQPEAGSDEARFRATVHRLDVSERTFQLEEVV